MKSDWREVRLPIEEEMVPLADEISMLDTTPLFSLSSFEQITPLQFVHIFAELLHDQPDGGEVNPEARLHMAFFSTI